MSTVNVYTTTNNQQSKVIYNGAQNILTLNGQSKIEANGELRELGASTKQKSLALEQSLRECDTVLQNMTSIQD
ncbi:hypothetical protein CEXT_783991 [Caerostris extrusa]|uniref:Uncharacterized protein n=1 Tax=Caerostris extrusa TaxID=172846 RepID=A0AAV4QP16_CAEEX|nr:hypothetical protein CEXT_783991 [Caerostris extrusa]